MHVEHGLVWEDCLISMYISTLLNGASAGNACWYACWNACWNGCRNAGLLTPPLIIVPPQLKVAPDAASLKTLADLQSQSSSTLPMLSYCCLDVDKVMGRIVRSSAVNSLRTRIYS